MNRLEGKVALITGGAQGQGAAATRKFLAEGAKVVIADIADELGGALADELRAGYPESTYFRHLDVTSEDDWAGAVDEAAERFGTLNVLVNNAGILMFSELAKTALADYERVVPLLLGDAGYDAVIVLFVPPVTAGGNEVAQALDRALASNTTEKPVLAALRTVVQQLGQSGEWYLVQPPQGIPGWIFGELLEPLQPAEDADR